MRMLIISIFLTSIINAVSAKSYTIAEIDKIIDANNYSVKKLQAISSSMKFNANVQGSEIMDTQLKYSLMDLTVSDNSFKPEMLAHQFSLMQTVPISGKLYFRKKAAMYDYINSLEDVREKKIEIKKNILAAVTDLWSIKEIQKNKQKEKELLERFLESSKAQYVTGKLLLANIVDVEIKLSQTLNMIIELKNMESILKNEIAEVLYINDDDIDFDVALDAYKKVDISKITGDELFKKSISYNPSLKRVSNNIEKYNNRIIAGRNNFAPDLELGFDYKLKPVGVIEHGFSIDVGLSLPIFSSIMKSNEVRMDSEGKKSSEMEKNEMENLIKNILKRKIIDLKNTQAQADLIEKRVLSLSDDTLMTMIKNYQVDSVNLDTLLNSVTTAYEMKNQYYGLLTKFYKLLFEIESISGEKYYIL